MVACHMIARGFRFSGCEDNRLRPCLNPCHPLNLRPNLPLHCLLVTPSHLPPNSRDPDTQMQRRLVDSFSSGYDVRIGS